VVQPYGRKLPKVGSAIGMKS